MLLGVGDGGAGHNELRAAPVLALADAPQPPQHQRSVAAEDAPVRVPLIHHDVAQVGQEVPKLAVHGQHAAVQHVRVGDEQVRPVSDSSSVLLQGMARSCLVCVRVILPLASRCSGKQGIMLPSVPSRTLCP